MSNFQFPVLGRPKTRAECEQGPRPCPWFQCRHHLAEGMILGKETCSLDLARRDGMTLDEVAEVLGISRERVRQIERGALRKLRDVASLR